jgi:Encapsulating protein for peroxidase
MNNLHRELAPISEAAWTSIEEEARRTLIGYVAGRKVVDVHGPEGPALAAVGTGHLSDTDPPADGVSAHLRRVQQLVELRVPFTLSRQAIDDVERGAQDSDRQPVKDAARKIAFAEDRACSRDIGRPGSRASGLPRPIRRWRCPPMSTATPTWSAKRSHHCGWPVSVDRTHSCSARMRTPWSARPPTTDTRYANSLPPGRRRDPLGAGHRGGVPLYFQESMTFLVYTTEAGVVMQL